MPLQPPGTTTAPLAGAKLATEEAAGEAGVGVAGGACGLAWQAIRTAVATAAPERTRHDLLSEVVCASTLSGRNLRAIVQPDVSDQASPLEGEVPAARRRNIFTIRVDLARPGVCRTAEVHYRPVCTMGMAID